MDKYSAHALAAIRLGVRSHALRGLVGVGLLLISFAFLAGRFSMRQPLVVSTDIGISGLRMLGVLLAIFWMQETFIRDIERKSLTLCFSYPVARKYYVLGRFMGVLTLLLCAVLIWGGMIVILGQISTWGYENSSKPLFDYQYLIILFGVLMDLSVLASFVLALISISTSALLPFFGGVMFAVASRSIGPVSSYLSLTRDADPAMKQHFLPVLEILRWVLPDLSLLDWRSAVLYGSTISMREMAVAVSGAGGFFMLMLLIAVARFNRREII